MNPANFAFAGLISAFHRSFEEMLDRAVSSLADKGFSLKEEQQISIKQLVQGGNLLAVLPTGFGKSLIFQMLALMENKSC